MATYLVNPPDPSIRMAFMDAVQNAEIFINRTSEGFEITTKDSQEETWNLIKQRFELHVGRDEPPIMII
jgi:hypothetical protein